MKCHFHPRAKAVDFCSVCGLPLCRQCIIEGEDGIYCEDCFAAKDEEDQMDESIDQGDEDYIDLELMDLLDNDDDEGLF